MKRASPMGDETSALEGGERLVSAGVRRYGRLAARPLDVNPLDERSALPRAFRRSRLKEWVGFALVHPDWHMSFIMQDAQYLASSELFAYDRRRRILHEHAGVRRGGSLALPRRLLDARCEFRRPGYRLEYDFSESTGRHRLRFDIAATRSAPSFRGVLDLDARRASPPLSVSARLPRGSMYTYKAIFPMEGALRVGDEEIVFDGSRDLAILDEHRSLLPYRTEWTWGTFAMRTGDGLVGANFANRPQRPDEEEESCIWSPRACEPLDDIRFAPEADDPAAPWRIASRDGRLDVVFEPDGRKEVKRSFGVVAIDYFTLHGHCRGTVEAGGRVYEVDRVPGVCERMRARL